MKRANNLINKKEKKDNLICCEIDKLKGDLNNYFASELKDILSLIQYIDILPNEISGIFDKIKFFQNIKNENIKPFFKYHSNFLTQLENIALKTKNDVINPLLNFRSEFETNNKEIIFNLNSITEQIINQESLITKKYDEYLEEMKKLETIGNDSKKKKIVTKSIDEKYSIYNTQINNMNKIYKSCELNYKKIKNSFDENNRKKHKIISNCLYIYFNYIYQDLNEIDNKDNDFKKLLQKYQTDSNSLSYINNNNIFNKSKLLNGTWKFEINKKEEANISDNNLINVEPFKRKLTIKDIDYEYMDFVNLSKSSFFFKTIDDNTIEDFFKKIHTKDKLSDNVAEIINIFENHTGDIQFYTEFFERFFDYQKSLNTDPRKKNTIIIFESFTNFAHFTNLLNNIIENILNELKNNNLKAYILLDTMICIGEKSVNENTFMCALLSKNKVFKDKKIWKNCIKNKIIKLLSEICEKEYTSKHDDSIVVQEILNKANLIKKNIFGKINGVIGVRNQNKNIIELCHLDKKIEFYNKLNSEQKKNINLSVEAIFHDIIKCYIRHITNYNYKLENKGDIISEICAELRIKDVRLSIFYCYYYSACLNSSKKIIPNTMNKMKNGQIDEKISLIKSKNNKEIQKKYPCELKNDHEKFIVIKHIFKYLNDEDKCKLILLGKYYSKINKNIYKYLLKQKNISNNKRMSIWKACLKYNSTFQIYNYSDILKEIDKKEFKIKNNDSIIQVNKDIDRTYFREKNEQTIKKIWNILISFVYNNSRINYFQGLNCICGFIYDLTKNEEVTFHLMVGLFSLTPLGDIFDENFEKLKIFFYISERLVYLYLPKIFSKLKDNSIQLHFFISPYFITLFTIIYGDLPEGDNYFILRVWDEFIINGWTSVFSVLLTVLKYHEKIILSLEDELLDYLGSTMKKSELFKNENYDKFCELKKEFIINDELLKTLENEVIIEAGIKKVGTSTILEDFDSDDK